MLGETLHYKEGLDMSSAGLPTLMTIINSRFTDSHDDLCQKNNI